jgi:hypothetical protein
VKHLKCTIPSLEQDHIPEGINELKQKNREILLKIEAFVQYHDELLKKIFLITKNILALDKNAVHDGKLEVTTVAYSRFKAILGPKAKQRKIYFNPYS